MEELQSPTSFLVTLDKYVAERRALITIAPDADISDLEAQLQKHRESRQYQLIVRKFQVVVKQLEVDQTAEALARLVHELNEGKPPK